jgi:hypothetical protein
MAYSYEKARVQELEDIFYGLDDTQEDTDGKRDGIIAEIEHLKSIINGNQSPIEYRS